jgi:hypothetical protein
MLGSGFCLTADSFYTSSQPADTLISNAINMYCAVKVTRKYMPPAVKTKELKKGEVVAFQRGKVMACAGKTRMMM